MFWQRMRTRWVLQFAMLPLILALSAGTVRSAPKETDAKAEAEIILHVPPDAAVWLDGIRSQYSGVERRFVTPPLAAGDRYFYDVRAVWTDRGRLIERRRQLSFRAGDRVIVDFPSDSRVEVAPTGVGTVAPTAVQTSYYYSPPATSSVAVTPVQRYYTPASAMAYTPVAPVAAVAPAAPVARVYYTYPYVRPMYISPSYIPYYPSVLVYP
jgi:uncharacterized protein (TIGR03000 family)